MQRSTREECNAVTQLINDTEAKILKLIAEGKKVHFIWDVDHVLVSGRSDDVFKLGGNDVVSYREYENRQFLQVLGAGPWGRFAGRCGQLFHSQDIVTARAGFPALRVMNYCLYHGLDIREMLFVGSQPKAESYRVILNHFQKDTKHDWFVFMVDDTESHIVSFNKIVVELGIESSTEAILSPRLRRYTEEELAKHHSEVMDMTKHEPYYASDGTNDGRKFLVTPNPRKSMKEMLTEELEETSKEVGARDQKRGYDAITEANRRARAELSSLLNKNSPPGFFDRHKNDSSEPEDPFTENALAWKEAYDRGETVPGEWRKLFEFDSSTGFSPQKDEPKAERPGDWYESSDLGDPSTED